MVVVRPQIQKESKQIYEEMTIQFQKLIIAENNLDRLLELDLCIMDCQDLATLKFPVITIFLQTFAQ